MGLTSAIAAAMGGYAERMAIAAQARRYGWMAALYARAVVLELGREALEENGDWVLMHRERPPEAPKGG